MMHKTLVFFMLFFCFCQAKAQTVKLLTKESKASFRGLSVVTDKIVWVSGSAGTVGRSLDSGNTWKWMKVKGFEQKEFRDIEAFSETSAIIMAVDEPAYILKTNDGGDTWQVVFENKDKGMFLDAMEFWNEQSGIVIGDPIGGKFFIARTFDGGITWQGIPGSNRPVAAEGEACFASSGTNIRKLTNAEAIFISGGKLSSVFVRDKKITLPMLQGKESTGANSIAIKNKKKWIIVGGDFMQRDSSSGNIAITYDAGKTWVNSSKPPMGYRSCIEYLRKKQWITCGLNGVDISNDDGKTFYRVSSEGFHVVRKAKKGKAVFFAGNGKIGKLVLQQ